MKLKRSDKTVPASRPSSHGARVSGSGGRLNLGALALRSSRRRHVVVFERTRDYWKALEAEVGAEQTNVIRLTTIQTHPDDAPPLGLTNLAASAKSAEVILVSNSSRAIVRLLQLPQASPEQTRRMIALRLETELPYPVAESAWVCERQAPRDPARPGRVLVVAAPAGEIREAETELLDAGIRCRSVEFDVAAFAELAVASSSPEEAVAAICIEPHRTTLTVTRAGELRYVRRIPFECEEQPPGLARLPDLANELDQSVQDYLLHADNGSLGRILVFGNRALADRLISALSARISVPAQFAKVPDAVRISYAEGADSPSLMDFASCLGAALAAHKRLHGNPTAAPALPRRRTALAEFRWRRRFILIGANVLLLAALIAGSFGVRATTLAAASRLIDDVQPYLADLEQLEEEVRILQTESAEKRPILDLFLALADVLPPGVADATLKVDSGGRVTISGKTPNVELVDDKAISAMEASPVFLNPVFLGTTQEKEGLVFRMTCEIRKGALE